MTQQTSTPNTQAHLRPVIQVSERAAFDDLPRYWQQEIKSLRAENGKYRRERNELRTELADAQHRIATQICDIADLKAALPAHQILDSEPFGGVDHNQAS